MNVLDEIVKDQLRTDIPELAPGDTVKVAAKVVEGTRERIQVFEGTVLRLTGGGITRSVTVLDEIVQDQLRTDLPELASGDTVKVSAKVVEGTRERIQVFEGTVMRLRGGGITRSITVRRIASGVGVERTFKINSPRIEKIEVVRHGVARRAQLYFLRDRVGKAATLRERRTKI